MIKSKKVKDLLFAVLLFLPVIFFYGMHFSSSTQNSELVPTGFIGYRDTPYKMALAREYWDASQSHLFYPLPYSDNLDNNPIYFQIHIVLLAVMFKVSGLPPGIVLCLFGFMFGILCLYGVIRLFRDLFGLESKAQWITLILFCWGGGLLSILGFSAGVLESQSIKQGLLESFQFDPDRGWWGLNFGRNLIYPMECYYHALVVFMVIMLFKKKYLWYGILLTILSLSHPMTGITFVLITICWILFEKHYLKNEEIPNRLLWTSLGLFGVILAYNYIYLGLDPEHAEIVETHWLVDGFTYQAKSFIPAYLIVGLIFFWQMRTPKLFFKLFSSSLNRFLGFTALIVFLLSNHEFAFEPHQPLHFEKGYVYFSLFLLGAPSLISFFQEKRVLGTFIKVLVVGLFLLDNLSWLSFFGYENLKGGGLKLTKSEQEILKSLDTEKYNDALVFCENDRLAYWISIYTPLRSLTGHEPTTPNVYEKNLIIDKYFNSGILPSDYTHRKLVIVDDKTMGTSQVVKTARLGRKTVLLKENDQFEVSLSHVN